MEERRPRPPLLHPAAADADEYERQRLTLAPPQRRRDDDDAVEGGRRPRDKVPSQEAEGHAPHTLPSVPWLCPPTILRSLLLLLLLILLLLLAMVVLLLVVVVLVVVVKVAIGMLWRHRWTPHRCKHLIGIPWPRPHRAAARGGGGSAIAYVVLTLAATSSEAVCMAIGQIWSLALAADAVRTERAEGEMVFHLD